METNRLILDTSAYSLFMMGNLQIKEALQSAEEIVLTPIILGELMAGFAMGNKEKKNRALLDEFLDSSRVNVLHIDEETSERYSAIVSHLRAQGTPIPTNDLWIAASAMQHGLKVITSDNHFLKVPQILTLLIEDRPLSE